MCTDAKIDGFSHFAKRIDKNRKKDDGGTRWNLQLVGQKQTSQTSQIADADGQPDDAFETMGEEVGGHLRKSEQGEHQHDAYHP